MPTVTTLSVTGMTCEHCVSAVTRELEAVGGVGNVTVQLDNGGTSSVTVHSATPLPESALRSAVDEAGYALVGVDVQQDALAAQMAQRADQYRESGHRLEVVDAPAASGGCACGCGGHGRQGLGIGLPIVAK
jgi:copper chaperone CopZ